MAKLGLVMNNFVDFVIPGLAIPKERARSVRVKGGGMRLITPERTRKFEKLVKEYAILAMGYHKPFERPCELKLEFLFVPPSSWPSWKRSAAIEGAIRHTSKPDLDNLEKAVKDAMNKVVYVDDSQVCSVYKLKGYRERNRIIVSVREIYEFKTKMEWDQRSMVAI